MAMAMSNQPNYPFPTDLICFPSFHSSLNYKLKPVSAGTTDDENTMITIPLGTTLSANLIPSIFLLPVPRLRVIPLSLSPSCVTQKKTRKAKSSVFPQGLITVT